MEIQNAAKLQVEATIMTNPETFNYQPDIAGFLAKIRRATVAAIERREYRYRTQKDIELLRGLSQRELMDIGIARGDIEERVRNSMS